MLLLFFQLGGGYLFGLPVGFVADSIGATIGAGAAFLLGRTVSFSSFTFIISCQRTIFLVHYLLLNS